MSLILILKQNLIKLTASEMKIEEARSSDEDIQVLSVLFQLQDPIILYLAYMSIR
jgi:hypothetical protein